MSLFDELKRRNVIRVAIAYAAVSWLVLQAGALVFDALELSNAVLRGLMALLALGFIPTMVFAWAYELTPEGLKRESEVDRSESVTRLTGRKLDYIVIGVLAAVVALLLVDKFLLHPKSETPVAAVVTADAGAESAKLAAEPPPAVSVAPTLAPPQLPSIAVLPFVDMSQGKDQEYFSDGLSEELLNLLAKLPQLRVIARTSSFSFKGKDVDVATIAKALDVGHVLEGSVRKSGDTLRITAQLIRGADSSHLWSETYDRELTDVFKIQDEIAEAVVAALKVKLLPSQPVDSAAQQTKSVEAYNLYLLGRQSFVRSTVDGFRASEAAYKRAMALDPGYAAAYAGLSRTQTLYSDFTGSAAEVAAMKREALQSAEKAIALAPDLSLGYEARGYLRATTLWDWVGAQADYDRALELDPGSADLLARRSELLAYQGRMSEAIASTREAMAVDPLSDKHWLNLGGYLLATEGTRPAREAVSRARELNPESAFNAAMMGTLDLLDGDLDAAEAEFKSTSDKVWGVYGTALIEHSRGNAAASQAALDRLVRESGHGAAYQIAEIHAWRGETDKAFEWLDRAYAQRDAGLAFLKFSVLFKPLRGDPRYAALLAKMGLPP